MNARRFLRSVAVLAALLVPIGPTHAQAQLPTETLTIRFFQNTAEIAKTPAQRSRGLMGRTSLPQNHGMLFVFEQPERQCFWMKNTPLPLSIAFIDAQGRISSIANMTPFSEETHCSTEPVPFALEMEQGWFQKRGVLAGDTVKIPPMR